MHSKDIKINIQIFTGGFGAEAISFNRIREKLDNLYQHFPIDNIIIGWSNDKKIYREIGQYLKDKNTNMLLWYPVFSELGYFRKLHPVIDFQGNESTSYQLNKGESFEFYCPTNRENLENIKSIYQENFGDIDIDGVFLDKIRYPSFANGLKALFSCFCPHCLEAMRQFGIDTEELIKKISEITEESQEFELKSKINISQNTDFLYQFKDAIWKKFFDFKKYTIYHGVKNIYDFFKERKMIVGLDVFTHSLGYFVGQDMSLLSNCGDFIKPMYYRKTWAPAGLPLEMDIFNKIFTLDDNCIKTRCGEDKTYPAALILEELKIVNKLNKKTEIYPGFEVNRNDIISPIYPHYVNESLQLMMDSNMKGTVLSWDLNNAPEDNLQAVYEFFER